MIFIEFSASILFFLLFLWVMVDIIYPTLTNRKRFQLFKSTRKDKLIEKLEQVNEKLDEEVIKEYIYDQQDKLKG